MLMADDVEMMQFAFRFLKQVLFGENTIERDEAELKQRLEKWRERQAQIEREAAERLARLEEGMYEATDEEVEASEAGGSCSSN